MLACTWGCVGGSHSSTCSPCGSAFHSAPAVCAARAMMEGWLGSDVLPLGHAHCGCGWSCRCAGQVLPRLLLGRRGHLTSKVIGGPGCLGQRQSPRVQAARTSAGCSRGAVGHVPSLHTCPAQQAAPLVLALQELRWGQARLCPLGMPPGVVTVQQQHSAAAQQIHVGPGSRENDACPYDLRTVCSSISQSPREGNKLKVC